MQTASGEWSRRFTTALRQHAASAPVPSIRVAAVLRPVAVGAGGEIVTAALLARLGGHDPCGWAPVLSDACMAHGIDSPLRVSAFLANVFTETGALGRLSESLDYTPGALLKLWPSHFTATSAARLGRTAAHPADQRGIATAAYGGRNGNTKPGDGWAFRGGGGLQTTGRGNYAAVAREIGWTGTLEALADHVRTPAGASESAAIFWTAHGCNAMADKHDLTACRRVINGGVNGMDTCKSHYSAACAALITH